jgi:hypothetical protein
LSY